MWRWINLQDTTMRLVEDYNIFKTNNFITNLVGIQLELNITQKVKHHEIMNVLHTNTLFVK